MPFKPLESPEAREEDLRKILSELEETTMRMRTMARMVVVNLAFGVLVAIVVSSLPGDTRHYSVSDPRVVSAAMSFIIVIPAAIGIWCLMRFEALRRHGEVLFEELSNEYQWQGVRGTGSAGPGAAEGKPEIHIRVALRSFIQASDLPLVPGKFGPTVYFLLFVVVAVAGVFLPRLISR